MFAHSVLYALLVALLLPQEKPTLPPFVKRADEVAPATQNAKPTGPMRVEPWAILDQRVSFIGDPIERAPTPQARLLLKLTGEKVMDIDRCGRPIIETMVDDKGTVLIDTAGYTDADRNTTSLVTATANVEQLGYIRLDLPTTRPPARAATKITQIKGYVNVVYGGQTEEITIDNPAQYAGGTIDHPRLKELGITIRVLKPAEEAIEPADNRGIAIRIEGKDEMVKNVDLYDEWMKRMSVRPRVSKTQKDETYFYYSIMGALLTPDCQMALTVYQSIEKEKIEFDIKDYTLP